MIVNPAAATLGFSLSPGGLLYPYHIGALASLEGHGYVTPSTALAGASAGAIAVISHAAGVTADQCLETTIKISRECRRRGGARGKLLPLLEAELVAILEPDAHEIVNDRPGVTALAHFEIFPTFRPVLETHFSTRDCLMESVLNSSMFPFFSTNWPVRFSKRTKNHGKDGVFGTLPRIVVDGYFAAPFTRFGCPDFALQRGSFVMSMEDEVEESLAAKLLEETRATIDRTVTVSVFPHDSVLLTASAKHDRISPLFNPDNPIGQVKELLELATRPLTEAQVYDLYERGRADADRWVSEESERAKLQKAGSNRDAKRNGVQRIGG